MNFLNDFVAIWTVVFNERKTSLWESLLNFGVLVIWINENQSITIFHECKCCLVGGNGLIGEVLENLLQSRLWHAVLLNTESSLFRLESAEKPSDSFAFLGDAKFEELSTLLEYFNLIEVISQVVDNS